MSGPARNAEARWGWLFLAPALLGIGIFTALPTLGTLGLSFASWDLLAAPRWVGLANYRDLLADPLFYRVMGQTLLFVALYVPLDLVLGLGAALALNRRLRGLGLLRTAYFLPLVTSMVAAAMLWSWIYDPRQGLLNALLVAWHGHPVGWLTDPRVALVSLVVVSLWKNLGYDLLLFLAGLQAVPGDLLEAADLDGAGAFQRFRLVTLPLLGPTMAMATIVATVRAFQTFDTVYLMTAGGPQRATTIAGFWLFQNAFTYFKLGKASALAFALALILAVISALQWRFRDRLGFQEEEA